MRLQAVRQNVGFGVNQRVNQRQLEAALRGYRLGYRATGYRRQNVALGVYQAVNRRLLTASFDAYRLAYRALRTSSMLAYAGPKLKFSEVAGSRARARRLGQWVARLNFEPCSSRVHVRGKGLDFKSGPSILVGLQI